MNNDEQDVKKKIMMVVGACLFLIAVDRYSSKQCHAKCANLLCFSDFDA